LIASLGEIATTSSFVNDGVILVKNFIQACKEEINIP
jgi:hypothetical protein